MPWMVSVLSLLVWSQTAIADINPATGVYSLAHADYLKRASGSAVTFEIRRFYRSNAKGTGLFGRAWCTSWDDRLEVKDNQVEIQYCGEGRTETFTKSANGWTHPRGLALSSQSTGWTYTDESGMARVFSKKGKLLGTTAGGSAVKFTWNNANHLTGVSAGGANYRIQQNADGFVTAIEGPGLSARYEYQDQVLALVTNGKVKVEYQYDPQLRLTRVNTGNKVEQIKYQTSGLVASVLHDGCEEKLNYQRKSSSVATGVEMICNGKVVARRDFASEMAKDGQVLSQSQGDGKNQRQVVMDAKIGKPVKISEGSQVTELQWDARGRLTGVKKGAFAKTYFYNPRGQIAEVDLKQGRLGQKLKYQYDTRGNVAAVSVGAAQYKVARDRRGQSKIVVSSRIPSARERLRSPAQADVENQLEFQKWMTPLRDAERIEQGVYQ